MKKFALLLIAACMLITCFACGGNGRGKTKVPPILIPPETKWGSLPDYDGGGEDFRISTRAHYGSMEVVVDDETSENIVDQALVLRNAKVEDRYSVFIQRQDNDGAQYAHLNQVLTDCTMQADRFDLAMTYVYESAPLITNGFVLNWNNLRYTHLDESHWIQGMNNRFSVRDAIYTAISKMCISTVGQTVAMYYNRDLGDQWKGEEFSEDLITTILDGGWTYDELMKIVNEYNFDDATGDGRTPDDGFGYYMSRDWFIDTWHAAWQIPMIENTVEDGLKDVYWSEKLTTYVDRMHTMYYQTPGIYYGTQGDARTAFSTRKALFVADDLNASINYYNNYVEDNFTIIPQPKFDENQENYYSAMFDNYSVMSIPITANADVVSLLVEALSISSEMHVYPAYKHDALQGQATSDVDSMFDIVLESVSWDIGTLLHSKVPFMDMVRIDVVNNPEATQIKTTYDSIAEDVAEALEEIMTAFDEFQEN